MNVRYNYLWSVLANNIDPDSDEASRYNYQLKGNIENIGTCQKNISPKFRMWENILDQLIFFQKVNFKKKNTEGRSFYSKRLKILSTNY